MRAFTMLDATKVLITAFALILSLAGFAEARDRGGDRQHNRRPHHERQYHDRSPSITGINHSHDSRRHHRWGRQGENLLVGRNKHHRYGERRYGERRYGERRFAYDRRPNRQIIPREYRGSNRNYWEPAYRNDGDGFPSYTTGGAYLGGISAWQEPGNGVYFSREGSAYDYGYENADDERAYRGHRAKIIRVNPSSAGRACSWESGVCVIRR